MWSHRQELTCRPSDKQEVWGGGRFPEPPQPPPSHSTEKGSSEPMAAVPGWGWVLDGWTAVIALCIWKVLGLQLAGWAPCLYTQLIACERVTPASVREGGAGVTRPSPPCLTEPRCSRCAPGFPNLPDSQNCLAETKVSRPPCRLCMGPRHRPASPEGPGQTAPSPAPCRPTVLPPWILRNDLPNQRLPLTHPGPPSPAPGTLPWSPEPSWVPPSDGHAGSQCPTQLPAPSSRVWVRRLRSGSPRRKPRSVNSGTGCVQALLPLCTTWEHKHWRAHSLPHGAVCTVAVFAVPLRDTTTPGPSVGGSCAQTGLPGTGGLCTRRGLEAGGRGTREVQGSHPLHAAFFLRGQPICRKLPRSVRCLWVTTGLSCLAHGQPPC